MFVQNVDEIICHLISMIGYAEHRYQARMLTLFVTKPLFDILRSQHYKYFVPDFGSWDGGPWSFAGIPIQVVTGNNEVFKWWISVEEGQFYVKGGIK